MRKTLMETMTLRQWYAGQALTGLLANKSNLLPGEKVKYAWYVADRMIAFEEEEEREREERRSKRNAECRAKRDARRLKGLAHSLKQEAELSIQSLGEIVQMEVQS